MKNQKKQNFKRINLAAQNEMDLLIFSTLCQDSIIKISNIRWAKRSKRFYLLLTRVCWEINYFSKTKPTIFKRVNSIMIFNNTLSVKSKGIQQTETDMVASLLTINYNFSSFEEQFIELIFSGNAKILLEIECIDAFLKDVSDPFQSTSSRLPNHQNDCLNSKET